MLQEGVYPSVFIGKTIGIWFADCSANHMLESIPTTIVGLIIVLTLCWINPNCFCLDYSSLVLAVCLGYTKHTSIWIKSIFPPAIQAPARSPDVFGGVWVGIEGSQNVPSSSLPVGSVLVQLLKKIPFSHWQKEIRSPVLELDWFAGAFFGAVYSKQVALEDSR